MNGAENFSLEQMIVRKMDPDNDVQKIIGMTEKNLGRKLTIRNFLCSCPNNQKAPPGFVAEYHGVMIGFVIVKEHHFTRELEILSCVVPPGFYENDVRRALVEKVIATAEELNYAEVTAHAREGVIETIQMFKALDFDIRERETGFFSDPVENSIVMSYTRNVCVPPKNRIKPILDWLENHKGGRA